jgi:hypothetical protein
LELCLPGYTCVLDTPAPNACPICQCVALDPTICVYQGNTYFPGATFPRGDFCDNTCSCLGDGGVECTRQSCPGACPTHDSTYGSGDVFPCDGCNKCLCIAPPGIARITNYVCDGGAPLLQACQVPSDCTGLLPSGNIPCSDGGLDSAHFDCEGGVCVDAYCE